MRLLILIACVFLCGCSSVVRRLSEEQIDRDYAGVIRFETPQRTQDGIEIPIRFSEGGWIRNSGICYKRNETEINGQVLTLRVFTAVCTGDATTPMIVLSPHATGTYHIEFEAPDGTTYPLSEISIP